MMKATHTTISKSCSCNPMPDGPADLNYFVTKTMRKLLFSVFMIFSFAQAIGQISSTGCQGETQYTNGNANDPIYYFELGQTGDLTATPPGGTPGWNFVWSKFTVGSTGWSFYSAENNVSSSTISNLTGGAYTVSIIDGTGTVVGCYIAWVSLTMAETSVDVAPIAPGCTGPVLLNGTINYGSITPYSNLPAFPMLIDANTQISVCYSGTHTWVSDLAFYMIGPATCGSPTLLLMPNPGAIGQGSICNSGNNISNLCFSTESSNNINVCNPAPATLSGTYGTYGATPTAINWSALYGCDASTAGWSVQIYDCIGGDVGALTDATITFTGTNSCGDPQTVSYTTPAGYSSTIADNSCSAGSASIFTVPSANPPTPIVCEYGYEWNSTPYVYIADSTTSLNIQLNQLIDASGNVMPWQDVVFSLSITSSCDTVAPGECFGGDGYDEELFDLLPTGQVVIDPVPVLCTSSAPQTLIANQVGGTWSGPGITDAVNGIFDPLVSGVGFFTINYEVNNPCISPGSITIEVQEMPVLSLSGPAGLCIDASPVTLANTSINDDGGIYSGNGITDGINGVFDPGAAGIGQHLITLSVSGICPNMVDMTIEVYDLPIINAGPDADVCYDTPYPLLATGAAGGNYIWSPATGLSNALVPNPTATITSNQTYFVTGTDIHGCSAQDHVVLTVLPLPQVSTQAIAQICPGSSVLLIASGSAGSYAWTPITGLDTPNDSTTLTTLTETMEYTVTVTDGCNLQASATLEVPVEEIYEVDAGVDVAICEGESTVLYSTIIGAYPGIEWSTTDGLIGGNPADANLYTDVEGTYMLKVTTPLGCEYNDVVHVDVIPLPQLTLVDQVYLCENGEVILHAGYSWDQVSWSNGLNTADIIVTSPGTYDVVVTNNGCQSSGSIDVIPVILPMLELGPDVSICQGTTIEFFSPIDGSWSTGDQDNQIVVSSEGTYSVTIIEQNCSRTDSVHVVVLPLPFVELGEPIVGCVDQPVYISAYHEDNLYYEWSTGEVGDMITVYEPDMYSVMVGNECGTMTDHVDVSFQDCSFSIYIPNTFTPDYDGINDEWKISTFNVMKFHLKIFNRWGDVVFETEDPQAVWTGGVDNGEYFVPDGVYTFFLKYETELHETGERSGTINVIR